MDIAILTLRLLSQYSFLTLNGSGPMFRKQIPRVSVLEDPMVIFKLVTFF